MIVDLLIVGAVIFLGLVIIDALDGASRWERNRK